MNRCSSSGACACFDGFTGQHCDIEASTKECRADTDCALGHVCDVGTGMCFGADSTCGAVQTCDMDTTCNGNGRYATFICGRIVYPKSTFCEYVDNALAAI